jgi:hypothetical protein
MGRLGGTFEVESTAWATLAFCACGGPEEALETLCGILSREQHEDSRVCVNREHPGSYWPTPLAILAWQGSRTSQIAQSRAVHFLLGITGAHFARKPGDPWTHDTALRGWPWIEGAFSWVEPTALCLMAIQATGHGLHDRVHEGIRMILDRQLPHGGWNVGNTLIFGKELRPNPESTGAALACLAGMVKQKMVVRSLEYAQEQVAQLRTPISLGWSLLGLAAWGMWPSNAMALIDRCLANESRYDGYDTSALSLLFLGALAGESDAVVRLFSHSSGRQAPAILSQ